MVDFVLCNPGAVGRCGGDRVGALAFGVSPVVHRGEYYASAASERLASRLLDTAGSEQARKDEKAEADRYRDYKHVPRRLRMNVWTCSRASIRFRKFVIAVDGGEALPQYANADGVWIRVMS